LKTSDRPPNGPQPKSISQGARLPGYLAASLVIVSSFSLIHSFGTNLPVADEWDFAPILLRFHQSGIDWATLTSFHNEHRQVLPSLYFFLVASLAGWDTKLIMFLNAVPVALSAWMVASILSKRIVSRISPLVSASVLGLLLGSWSQWQNFLWGFQFPWFFIPFCLVLGSYLLLEAPGWPSRCLAIAALFAATLCQANGFLTLFAISPLWLFLPQAKGYRGRLLVILLVGFLAAFLVATYGSGSGQSTETTVRLSAAHPLELANWLLYLLGQPLTACLTRNAGSQIVGGAYSQAAGLLALTPILLALIRAARGKRTASPLTLFALTLVLFGLASALIFAVGRFSVVGQFEI
jgi:hypothetical protein